MSRVMDKVIVPVAKADQPHLGLYFCHPMGGEQLVAGTVEVGETPSEAAVRELREEAGLELQGARCLGTRTRALPPNEGFLLSEAAGSPIGRLTRGRRVRFEVLLDGRARVVETEWDLSRSPPIPVATFEGAVDAREIATAVTYHVVAGHAESASVAWRHRADGHEFAFGWSAWAKPPRELSPLHRRAWELASRRRFSP